MPKKPNQKLKILYLLRILEQQSDEAHPLTIADIQRELQRHDISAERKSLYDDLEALRSFGADVINTGRGAYYLGSRAFELAELKLLVDSVQASRFITHRKSEELIGKIEELTSQGQARQLQRQVYVQSRIKTMNESIYYNVDSIHSAIGEDKQISFRYFDYSVEKERVYRRSGARYRVSPYALTWDDANYYLLAWDAESSLRKHYRVDRMSEIQVEAEAREGREAFPPGEEAAFARRVFGMFNGEEKRVQLRFRRRLAGAVIDRFGKDVILVPDGEDGFAFTADVAVSPQFFGWLCGFGAEAQLLGPPEVAAQFRSYVAEILAGCPEGES